MKIAFAIAVALLCASVGRAATYTAASCSLANVQTAFTNEQATPANGDIIVIPSGICTWTGVITGVNTTVTLTVQGSTTVSGNCYPTACTATDNTKIIDGRSGGGAPLMSLGPTGSSSQVIRFTGITLQAQSGGQNNGMLSMGSSTAGPQVRIDHCHFMGNYSPEAVIVYRPTVGVADHNVFDAPAGSNDNGIKVFGQLGNNGNPDWAAATGLGTSDFFFFENNTFNNGWANDCNVAGKYVARYNVLTTADDGAVGQSHATGSAGDIRGCRAWEVYNNKMNGTLNGNNFATAFQTSGTGMVWGNVSVFMPHDVDLVLDRDGNFTYPQSAPPAGWGYCGTTQTGSASNWDGNVNTGGSHGWPCIDQPGRGQGDLLSGTFPTKQNNTSPGTYTGVWPHQALEPVYVTDETWSCASGTGCGGTNSLMNTNSPNGNIVANRDYYAQVGGVQTNSTTPFNGTTGTGYGTLANRPLTCSSSVYYFATDQGAQGLGYQCQSSAWVLYYTPYTYPHPLDTNTGTPVVTYSPTSIVFTPTQVNQSSAATSASLQNTGTATLNVTSFTLTNNKFYVINNTCGSPATLVFGGAVASFSLAASATCTFSVVYLPQSVNNVDAGGVIAIDNTAGGSDTLILSGIGVTAPAATAQFQ